jgi:diacylglycerol kinase (ATP)
VQRDRSLCVIVNPAAGRGRSPKLFAALNSFFPTGQNSEVLYTERPGDEEHLARLALENGARVLVAVGGDGTCSGVANAILRSGRECRLAVVASGTGNDFAKTLGVVNMSPEQVGALVSSGSGGAIDVGLIEDRYFLNSCGFGFDAAVLEATQRLRFLKGNAVYIYSALRQLLTYRGVAVSLGTGEHAESRKMLMVTVSNGRFLGGAFRIAPGASVVDAELDACFFGATGIAGRVRSFAGAFRGSHIGLPWVKSERARVFTFRFSEMPMMEVDGELRRARSPTVELRCVPRALSVVAAPGAIV